MNRILAGLAAGLAASALALPAPASADFFIKKTKPKASASQPQQRQPRNPRRVRQEPRAEEVVAAPPTPIGIDPALMEQAVTEARYTAKLIRNPATKTALIEVTNGKSGWSVNFKDCAEENLCGAMEFYTLWRVSNEANVCTVWGNDVAKDPTRNLGKPFCYVVPNLNKQLHLKLSTEQAPYAGLVRLSPDLAKEQMRGMIATWSNAMAQLPQAWQIAVAKCPKVTDKCAMQAVVNIPDKPTSRNN
jgi:hypothetical protein